MSYASVEEADEYIASHYLADDSDRKKWESLDTESKQILLTRSMGIIDNLPLTGRKHSCTQPNAFPRNCDEEVPSAVKAAEIELALSLSDTDMQELQNEYRRLVDYGISSYSIGNFSESILTYGKGSLQMQYGLVSTEAERYLSPWLRGGFCIGN